MITKRWLAIVFALMISLYPSTGLATDGFFEGWEPMPINQGGTASDTAAGARTSLGITELATQDPAAIAITGGTIDGVDITTGTWDGRPSTGFFREAIGPNITVDFNNYDESGTYSVGAWTTNGVANGPVGSEQSGMLKVSRFYSTEGLEDQFVAQEYLPYQTDGVWVRFKWANSWGAWREIFSTDSDGTGSGMDSDFLDGNDSTYFVNGVAVGATADPNTTLESYIVTNNINSPDSSKYWHIESRFYAAKDLLNERSQTAIEWNDGNSISDMYVRGFRASVWTPWTRVDNGDLGTMADQDATSVNIDGGDIAGITDLRVADGGTGGSTATEARTNLIAQADLKVVSSIELGDDLTGDRNSVLDLHADETNVDFSARIIRAPGVNGDMSINNAGTGNVSIASLGGGTVNMSNVNITGGTITGVTDVTIADGGTGASDAGTARTNLGLGSMATQASSAVAITGGTITGIAGFSPPFTTSSGVLGVGVRVPGSTYTNSTGNTMLVVARVYETGGAGSCTAHGQVAGATKVATSAYHLDYAGDRETWKGMLVWAVPNGSTYRMLVTAGSCSHESWTEFY